MSVRAGTLALLLALLTGCGGDSQSFSFSTRNEGLERRSAVPGLRDAREVRHAATRVVEVWDRSSEPARYLAWRERFVSDGEGRFSLEPLAPLTEVAPDWGTFELLQRARARFQVRYRDFAVRDQGLFLQNWALRDLGREELVAGRPCELFEVRRLDGSHGFELAVDAGTGLLLRSRELDREGRPIGGFTVEALDLDPDLDAVVFHRSTIDEEEHALERSAQEAFGAPVLTPRLLPRGYALRGQATLREADGTRWAKRTYTDGVETLFFAERLAAPGELGAPHRRPEGDSLTVVEARPVAMASGTIGAHHVVVAGKVGSRELLDLVESALR